MKQASFHCAQCRQPRLFQQEQPNHVAHLLASVFLCGLWLPIWALIAAQAGNNPWRCAMCGFSDRVRYLQNPGLRAADAAAAANEAATRERLRAEYRERMEFEGHNASWFGEHWAGLGPGQKLGYVATAALVAGIVGTFAIGLVRDSMTASSPSTPPPPTAVSAVDDRRNQLNRRIAFSNQMTEIFKPNKIRAAAEGDDAATLRIEGSGVNGEFVTWFKDSTNFFNASQLGFKQIYFRNGKFEVRTSIP
jgi:hypothetical protein